MTDEVMERLVGCIQTVRSISGEVSPDSFFKRDLQFESIDIVDLLFELEREFRCSLTMTELNDYVVLELKNMTWDFTPRQLRALLQRKLP